MIRVAAFALALAATPASAKCVPVRDGLATISTIAGPGSAVRILPDWLAPAIVAWAPILAPGDGFVAAIAGPGEILLFPSVHGQLCDGTAARVSPRDVPAFLGFVREWMDERGYSKERAA